MITGPLINNLADKIAFVEFFVALVASLLFVAVYLGRHWWSTPQGRALMVKGLGNVFLLGLAVVTLLFGQHFEGRGTIRLVGMSLFSAGLVYLLWTLLASPGAENFPPRSWLRRKR